MTHVPETPQDLPEEGHEPVAPSGGDAGETAPDTAEAPGASATPVPDFVPDDLVAEQSDIHPDTALAEQRLQDLLRERADFTNFRNRVKRERENDRSIAVGQVVEALLPVLDDIHSARAHGDLAEGPMAAIATKLEDALARFGVVAIAETGVTFDPTRHEAMMHDANAEVPEGVEGPVVTTVMQPGYLVGDRLVRAARVIVSGA